MTLLFTVRSFDDGYYCGIDGHPWAFAWGATPWAALTNAVTFAMLDAGVVAA